MYLTLYKHKNQTPMSDRSEEEASARHLVQCTAPIIFFIDEHGDEQVSEVQQSRIRSLNQTSTKARDDDQLANALQNNREIRELNMVDANRARSKRKFLAGVTTPQKSAMLYTSGSVSSRYVICHVKVSKEGKNELHHILRF